MIQDTQMEVLLDQKVENIKLKRHFLIERLSNNLESNQNIILAAAILSILKYFEETFK